MNLPQEFLKRMQKLLGPEYEAFLKTYEEPRKFGLRVNTKKISVEEFRRIAPFHLTEIPWIRNGFYYEREDDPARHPFYYAGLYYLQEPSAMTPAGILPVAPGERVLDLCAAPGGKATALGAKLRGEGLLVANDISASRAKALLKNLEVFGIGNSFVTNAAPAKLAVSFPGFFDKILVDAPCSGEGMFRKDIANARVWSLQKVADCAKIQHEITRQAVAMLRPGGLLLYSTCTFSPEENEQTIAGLLQEYPELELLELPWYEGFAHGMPELADGNEELRKCVRIFPHRMAGEGHFLALLWKRSGVRPALTETDDADCEKRFTDPAEGQTNAELSREESGRAKYAEESVEVRSMRKGGKKSRGKAGRFVDNSRQNRASGGQSEERAALEAFLADLPGGFDHSGFEIRKGQVYYTQNRVPVGSGIPFLRNGLYFGEVRKGRFEPSQSLAMALDGSSYAAVLNFSQDDERVRRYLRGETVEADDLAVRRPSGWQLVCVEGYPLGWGKLVNGTLKNKYHPGWRMTV